MEHSMRDGKLMKLNQIIQRNYAHLGKTQETK